MSEELVKINKYSSNINELAVERRIETNIPILVRKSVVKMLKLASDSLPKELHLQVDGGYRSMRTEEILWKNKVNQLGLKRASKLVGDPYGGKILSHPTGGAVDVSLLDINFKEINLSEPFEKYYDEQNLYSKKITQKAQELRLTLYNIMLSAGFAPHDSEYWHFSYGDERWAKYYNKKPIYDQIQNSEKYFYPLLTRYFYKLKRRIYKLINRILSLKTNY